MGASFPFIGDEAHVNETLKLLAIFAHPDDESLGVGSTLAKYAAEGVEIYLVCATRGERGWMGDEKDNPGLKELGNIRERELLCAAETLGIKKVYFLDYLDGDVDQADPKEMIEKIAAVIRVAISFGPDGAYGHPDHIAISQFSLGACTLAADSSFADAKRLSPYRVSKFYYFMNTADLVNRYSGVFGDVRMEVDGAVRFFVAWDDWLHTTVIDGSAYWRTAREAVNCHKSQVSAYGVLNDLSEEKSVELWGKRTYYRVFSLVNGGRDVEADFFAGLR